MDRPLFWTLIFTFLLLHCRIARRGGRRRVPGVGRQGRRHRPGRRLGEDEGDFRSSGQGVRRPARPHCRRRRRRQAQGSAAGPDRPHAGEPVDRGGAHRPWALHRQAHHQLPAGQGARNAGEGRDRLHREAAPRIVVVPVWSTGDGATAWDENPLRRAWQISRRRTRWCRSWCRSAISTMRKRCRSTRRSPAMPTSSRRSGCAITPSVLVAIAEPVGENAIHAKMRSDTPLGRVLFDKTYTVESGGGCRRRAKRRPALSSHHDPEVEAADGHRSAGRGSGGEPEHRRAVLQPFEFSVTRGRLMASPRVAGVDISTISGNGAIIELSYTVPFQQPGVAADAADDPASMAIHGCCKLTEPRWS